MRLAFYLPNKGLQNIDCRDLETLFMTFLLLKLQDKK